MVWPASTYLTPLLISILIHVAVVWGCNKDNREVGVCLHVYLERDFLTMEGIVYPKHTQQRREMLYNSYAGIGEIRELPPLPDLPPEQNQTYRNNESSSRRLLREERAYLEETWGDTELREGGDKRRKRRWIREKRNTADNYAVADNFGGHHGWVEGPELEDYCSRLGSVITCFEEVLVNCENGYDFFRYRHLLHSLARVHQYLCYTPYYRTTRFLPFLKVIDCAETARLEKKSCHRPNITVNVWNQILRLEVGPEICDSLNTQRSCLLDNDYVHNECEEPEKGELYRNVSAIFLATWCRLPLQPDLILPSSAPSSHQPSFLVMVVLLILLILGKMC